MTRFLTIVALATIAGPPVPVGPNKVQWFVGSKIYECPDNVKPPDVKCRLVGDTRPNGGVD